MRALAAVIGDPVAHSLSPDIFRAFSREAGRPLSYRALRVPLERLKDGVRRAKKSGWIGWNVTLPHKIAIIGLLDELDASAREIGAVNVVRFARGRAVGYNTDAEGFWEPLRRRGFSARGSRAVVFGAGGAARAACAALMAQKAEVVVLNRTEARARALSEALKLRWAPMSACAAELAAADLVVNATSAGLDGRACPLPEGAAFKPGALAYDLVYRPARTPFLKRAEQGGARTLGGLAMLVAQAAATWKIWFTEDVPAGSAERIEAELDRRIGRTL